MDIRPIRDDSDHEEALAEIERLWNAEPGSPEHDRLEILGILVNAYEDRRFPVEVGDPVDAIRFQMDQAGHTQADLAALLGSRSRASEVLARKRPLTMEMAEKLHRIWRIPAECLIAARKVVAAAPAKPDRAKARPAKLKAQIAAKKKVAAANKARRKRA